jgi:hypothetical protein
LAAATCPSVALAGRSAQDGRFGAASDGRPGPRRPPRPRFEPSGRATAESPAAVIARAAPAGHQALAAPLDSQRRIPGTGRASRPEVGDLLARDLNFSGGIDACRTPEANPRFDRVGELAPEVSWTDQLSAAERRERSRNSTLRIASFRAWRGHVDQVAALFASGADSGLIGRRLAAAPPAESERQRRFRSDTPCGVDDRGLSSGSERLPPRISERHRREPAPGGTFSHGF